MNLPKDPTLAAILSVIIPGLGQFYCRQWVRGMLFLVGVFFLATFAPPIGIGVWVWGIIDAYRIGKSLQGYTDASERPAIDLSRLRLPKMDWKRALPYIAVPLGVATLFVLIGTIVIFRLDFWRSGRPEASLHTLIEKVENHKTQTGSYPDSLEALIDPTDPIEKKQTLDRWGNVYIFRPYEKGFDLFSAGKDGKAGTSDDALPG